MKTEEDRNRFIPRETKVCFDITQVKLINRIRPNNPANTTMCIPFSLSRNPMKHNLFLILLFCLLSFFAGCVTAPPPTDVFIRTNASPSSLGQNVGLLVDAVIGFDSSGASNRCISLEDSRKAAAHMLAESRQFLESKGYGIQYAEIPATGASFSGEGTMTVAERRYGPEKDTVFPIPTTGGNDDEYQAAIIRVIRQAFIATRSKGELPEEQFRTDPEIPASLRLIAQRKNVDHLIVVIGNGRIVSAGKQLGQSIATSIVTTVITAGLVTETSRHVSFLDSLVAVIDLRTSELTWSNALRFTGNPAEPAFYKGKWSKTLLYHLPPPSGVSSQPSK